MTMQRDTVLTPSTEEIRLLYEVNLEMLGDRLRRARLERKISQRDLSDGLFTSAYLSSLELGKTRPTFKTLSALAQRLDKSLDYFLRQSGGPGSELDQEQIRMLEIRFRLLSAQVALEKVADERAWSALEKVEGFLNRLSEAEKARYYYLLGKYHNMKGDTTQALLNFDEAHHHLKEGYDQETEMLIEMGQGAAYYNQRKIMTALSHFNNVANMLLNVEEGAAVSLRWKALVNMGHCWLALNETKQAVGAYQEALDNAGDVLDASTQATLHFGLAGIYSDQRDFQKAALHLGRCLQLYQQAEDQSMLLLTHNALARIFADSDQYDRASQQVQDALQIARRSAQRDSCQELNALITQAVIQQRQKQYSEAQTYIDQAMQLGENCNDPFYKGRLFMVAAELKADQDDRDTARNYYEQALTAVRDSGLANMEGDIYHSYGQRLRSWGDLERAFELMEQAYKAHESSRNNNRN